MTDDAPAPQRGLRRKLYAWMLARWSSGYDPLVTKRKAALLGDLRGTVVEIGPGTGPNLALYRPDVHWIGFEPNGYMDGYLRAEARRLGRDIDVRGGTAENLPLPDASADAVVATLVLCSVSDQVRALQEIRRVLKPGGRYAFLEHVAAPRGSRLHRVQNLINPGWRLVADGCHVNRHTGDAIERVGFSHVQIERFSLPQSFASPHIAGYAVK
jgi:SAM-dependent methyltransferase